MKCLINIFVLALLACSAMSVPIGMENSEQLMNEEQMEQLMKEQPQSEQLVDDKIIKVREVQPEAEQLVEQPEAEQVVVEEPKAEELVEEPKAEQEVAEPKAEEMSAEEPKAEQVVDIKTRSTKDEQEAEQLVKNEEEAQQIVAEDKKIEKVIAKAEHLMDKEKTEAEQIVNQEPKAEQVTAEEPKAEQVSAEEPKAEQMSAEEPKAEQIVAEDKKIEKVIAKAEHLMDKEKTEAEQIVNQEPEAEQLTKDVKVTKTVKPTKKVTVTKSKKVRSGKNEPEAEQITAEEPKAEQMSAEEPKAEQEVAEEPKAEQEVAEPKAEEMSTEEPKAEQATAEEPKSEQVVDIKTRSTKDEQEAEQLVKNEEEAQQIVAEDKKIEKVLAKAEHLMDKENTEAEQMLGGEPEAQELKKETKIFQKVNTSVDSKKVREANDEQEAEQIVAEDKKAEKVLAKAEHLIEKEKAEAEQMIVKQNTEAEQLVAADSIPEVVKTAIIAETTPVVATPCDTKEFKYYQPHPTDAKRYYQCDPWGTSVEHTCEDNLIWDRWTLKCEEEKNVHNLTIRLPSKISSADLFNCTLPEYECLNGGECILQLNEYKCSCAKRFTGEFCEVEVADSDLFSDIMNGNFSLEDYVKRLLNENITMDTTYYEKYKSVLDETVYEKLMEYLSHYKKGLIRYDTLVNSLIEDILGDIYPDADFLRSFNISTNNVVTTVRLIPNLLSYARYSAEHYKEVFAQYQTVLEQLWTFLNTTSPRLIHEAERYTELTEVFLNETVKSTDAKIAVVRNKNTGRNFFNDPTKITRTHVLETIKVEYEHTLNVTCRVAKIIPDLVKAINVEYEKNREIVRRPLVQTKLSDVSELVNYFEEIQHVNLDIWDTLVSYGFWYVTRALTTQTPGVVVAPVA